MDCVVLIFLSLIERFSFGLLCLEGGEKAERSSVPIFYRSLRKKKIHLFRKVS